MTSFAKNAGRLLRQQAAVAAFGSFALRQSDLPQLLSEAARLCANGLDAPFCKVCRFRADHNDLLVEAGYGWQEGVVGEVISRADASSPQGRAFATGQPSIANSINKDATFVLPDFYAKHGIASSIDVIIKGQDQAYGVLEVDNDQPQTYDQHDIDFLTSFANVLAEAVAKAERMAAMKATIAEMQVLVEQKDRLISQNEAMRLEQRRLEAALDQRKRLEALGRLTGGVAHDFNNLLTIILGNLQLIKMNSSSPRTLELVAEAVHAVNAGARINKRLLSFAGSRNFALAIANINDEVAAAVDLIEKTVGETISINTRLEARHPNALLNSGEFQSALVNLSLNARDAMPNGGELKITTSDVVVDEKTAALEHVSPGQFILVQVSDNGLGMTEDVVAKAFEPFFTTKPIGQGSGLGLASVHGFAKQSMGFTNLQSVVGQGTTIGLYFPMEQRDVSDSPEPIPGSTSNIERSRILVVEDNRALLKLASEFLTTLGYSVLPAETAKEALELLRADPSISLVFSDIILPGGMSGIDLAIEIRAHTPNMKILLTSGYPDAELRNASDETVEMPLLHKPYTLVQLQDAIEGLFGKLGPERH
jgi:signal transduction histidine kinase/CheY-like chemotaxis protein